MLQSATKTPKPAESAKKDAQSKMRPVFEYGKSVSTQPGEENTKVKPFNIKPSTTSNLKQFSTPTSASTAPKCFKAYPFKESTNVSVTKTPYV